MASTTNYKSVSVGSYYNERWAEDNVGKAAMVASHVRLLREEDIPTKFQEYVEEEDDGYIVKGFLLGRILEETSDSMSLHFGWLKEEMSIPRRNIIQVIPDDVFLGFIEDGLPSLAELAERRVGII